VLVFYVVQFGDARSRKRAMYLLSAGAVMAVVWALAKPMQIARQELVSFLFAIALIPLFNFDLRIAQSRWLRPVMWCGVMCYSLYLVHYPVELLTTQLLYNAGVQGEWSTLFVTVPLSLCASLLCAWAFYLLVERRFLNSAPILPTRVKSVAADLPVSVNA